MKRTVITCLLLVSMTIAGCATMENVKGSISTQVAAITSNVDPKLVAQVPEDKRGEFPKAEFAVNVAKEKLKLAQMKTDLAAKQKKLADSEEDMVSISQKDANLDYDMVKLKAVVASGVGKQEENIKTETNLKLKKVDLQSDRIKAEANMAATKRQIDDLVEKIKVQDEIIKALK